MTKKAIISTAELKRMAAVAKSEGVTIEVEIDGKIVRVSPLVAETQSQPPKKKERIRL